jgi:ankyrin repeat protein
MLAVFDAAVDVIGRGDVEALRRLLADHPELATVRDDEANATLLIRLIDWPGHRPNAGETARALLEAGCEVDARRDDENGTALAGAVCTQEIDVIKVLLDRGADIHAPLGWRDGTVLDLVDQFCEDMHPGNEKAVVELSLLFGKATGRDVPRGPKVGHVMPLVFVPNVSEAMKWYCAILGFHIDFVVDDCQDPADYYAGLSRGSTSLHLSKCWCDDGRTRAIHGCGLQWMV